MIEMIEESMCTSYEGALKSRIEQLSAGGSIEILGFSWAYKTYYSKWQTLICLYINIFKLYFSRLLLTYKIERNKLFFLITIDIQDWT